MTPAEAESRPASSLCRALCACTPPSGEGRAAESRVAPGSSPWPVCGRPWPGLTHTFVLAPVVFRETSASPSLAPIAAASAPLVFSVCLPMTFGLWHRLGAAPHDRMNS